MALPTHLNTSLTARGTTIATDGDPSNACCLSNDEGQSKTALSTYETVKPTPSFWKETAVKAAHILVGGPLFGCGGGDQPQGCQDDYDCREPRVCVRGYCEDSRSGNGGGN